MRNTGLLFILLLSGMLSACVTTTTGGFNVEPSEEEAQEDYIQLAVAYFDAGDLAGARRHINNAIQINDRNTSIYNVLALIFQQEGDLELAEENFERAIRLDRSNSRARNNYAALLFSQGKFEEAYEQLVIVTEDTMYEGRAIAFENLGRSAIRLGKTLEAELAFQRALQLNGNLYVSAVELAILRADREDWAGARNAFQRYLTTADFYNIPHTPRALLAGISIESRFQNQDLVRDFTRILTTLYRESPEYEAFLELSDVN
ncbi:MAG: type IV pilus biogenesis/stability protein PilW [Gammaproteobacteria bacterium]